MRSLRFIAVAVLLLYSSSLRAEDAFFRVPLSELELAEGQLPAGERVYRRNILDSWPRVIVEGGEGYVEQSEAAGGLGWMPPVDQLSVFVRAPQGKGASGRLFFPNADKEGMTAYRFTIPASAAAADAKQRFHRAKSAHFGRLMNQPIPGGAWFRHQQRTAIDASGQDRQTTDFLGRGVRGELDNTYDLFSGGRAVSENLQLDRVLPAATQGAEKDPTPVKIESIKGVTVKEMDWKPLIKDIKPQLDPLASKIPADQHAV